MAPIGGPQVRTALEHVAGNEVRPGAQPVDPVLAELRVQCLVGIFHRLGGVGRRIGEQEHPVELAQPQPQVVARVRRAGRRALHHLLHRRGGQRRGALAHRARVRAQLRRDGQHGEQLVARRRQGHRDRRLISRPPLGQLAHAAPELSIEQPAKARRRVARGVTATGVHQRLLELARGSGHQSSVRGAA